MHHSVYVWLVVVTWILLIATIFLATVSNTDQFGIFQNTIPETILQRLDVNPASWVFYTIWPAIFTYQVIWLIYATVNIYRRTVDGVPLYACAPFIHWSVFVVYIINLISNVAWLFLNDMRLFTVGAISLSLGAFSMWIATALSIYGIYRYYPLLAQNGFKKENRYVLGLVSNAFAMYGTWITLASLLTVGTALTDSAGVPQQASSAIFLAILTVMLMIWVLLDLAFLERFTRFVFTPYVVLSLALSGIIANIYDGNDPNNIMSVMLLIVVIVVLCVKICLVVHREMKMPAFKEVVVPSKTIIIYT